MQLKGEGFLHPPCKTVQLNACYSDISSLSERNSKFHYEHHCYKMQIKAM